MNEPVSRPTPMVARFLLGLFILWQLFFLISCNLLSLLPKARESWQNQKLVQTIAPDWSQAKGRIAGAENAATIVTARWAEATGQPQNWSLFAPNVTSIIPFLAVEFCWEDDPNSVVAMSYLLAPLAAGHTLDEISLAAAAQRKYSSDQQEFQKRFDVGKLREHYSHLESPPAEPWRRGLGPYLVVFSENEPRDKRHYVKLGHFRLRRYESCIDISPASADKEPDSVVDAWREEIEGRIRERWRLIQAYLRWQYGRLLKDHPGLPEPRQVILWVRIYRVPSPWQAPSPWNWQGPEWHPVARWQPGAQWSDNLLPVEMFNPVVGRFESLRSRDEPRHE
jgi:hypothetical protein